MPLIKVESEWTELESVHPSKTGYWLFTDSASFSSINYSVALLCKGHAWKIKKEYMKNYFMHSVLESGIGKC